MSCAFCPTPSVVTINGMGFCAPCAALYRQVALDKLEAALTELRRMAATHQEEAA